MFSPSTLAKKTKAEIIEEYGKMQEKLEEIKENAHLVHAPESLQTIGKVKSETVETILDSITEFNAGFSQQASELVKKVHDHLNTLSQEVMEKIKSFDELQRAIELSQKTLQNHYHLQIAAETIQQLVDEYEIKKRKLQEEFTAQKLVADEESGRQKRDWTRAQEELAYATKRQREREQEQWQDEQAKREAVVSEREKALAAKEEEFKSMQREVEFIPQKLQKELAVQEKILTVKLNQEWQSRLDQQQREREAQQSLWELKFKNLENIIKRQENEMLVAKKEQELANKKAQELAVKVIEHSTRLSAIAENKVNSVGAGISQLPLGK